MAKLKSTRLAIDGVIFKGSNDVRHIVATAGASAGLVSLENGSAATGDPYILFDVGPLQTVHIDLGEDFVRFDGGCFFDRDANIVGVTVFYG